MFHHALFGFVVLTCFSGYVSAEERAAPGAHAAAIVYSAPAEEKLSDDFELKIDSHKTPVYSCRVSAMPFNQVWPGYQRPLDQTELASFAYWDAAGPVEVEVISRRPVESVAIRPTSSGIRAKVEGNRILFRMSKPRQITVEVNGWHKALHLFANSPETAAPNPKDSNVRFFGPGVHRPGIITLESNQTVYLAGGAVVYGAIDAKGASNVQILGRGILDTSQFERIQEPYQVGGCIRLTNCKNVKIDGIILRDPNVWCLSAFNCSKVDISNVKLIGLWRYNSDGIDICNSQDATIRGCFVQSFDDSIVVKGLSPAKNIVKGLGTTDSSVRNVLVENCVIWNDWGRALEIGAETAAPEMSNLVFRDCDIIRTTYVAMDIQHGDRAAIKDVLFENIRLEIDDVNMSCQYQNSRDEKYAFKTDFCPKLLVLEIIKCMWSQDAERGTLERVTMRNCSVTGKHLPQSFLRGFDAQHEIKDVKIENLRINGRAMKSLKEAGVNVGPFVHGVHIQ
jgi:hypothetical protein